jgi:hypothetical protein
MFQISGQRHFKPHSSDRLQSQASPTTRFQQLSRFNHRQDQSLVGSEMSALQCRARGGFNHEQDQSTGLPDSVSPDSTCFQSRSRPECSGCSCLNHRPFHSRFWSCHAPSCDVSITGANLASDSTIDTRADSRACESRFNHRQDPLHTRHQVSGRGPGSRILISAGCSVLAT